MDQKNNPPAPAPTDVMGTRWATIAALVLAGTIAAAQMFKYSPALPLIREELGIGLVAGGWLISLANLLGALIGVAAGLIADRFGQRRMLAAGLTVFAVATALGGAAQSETILFISRFLEGFGFLCVVITGASLIARESAPEDRAVALSFWGCYNPIGGALMLITAPYIITALGWRGLWFTMSVVVIITLIIVALSRPRARVGTAPPVPILDNLKLAAAVPGAWVIGFGFGLYTLQYVVVMSWLPTVLIEHHQIPIVTTGFLTAFAIFANVGGNLLAGRLLKRGLRYGTIITTGGLLIAGSACIIFSDLPNIWRYLGCVSLSLWGGLLPGAVMASVPFLAPTPAQIGAINGFAVQGSNLGLLLGPPLAGAIVTFTGDWNHLLLLFLVASGTIMVAGTLMSRLEARVRGF